MIIKPKLDKKILLKKLEIALLDNLISKIVKIYKAHNIIIENQYKKSEKHNK